MNKPHVEALAYRFHVRSEGHYFARAEPWEGELGSFRCRLADGQLGAKPLEHFSSSNDARAAVEHGEHPAPPTAMAATPLVEVLRSRLRDIRYGREKLLAGAYYCLTRIKHEYGGDKEAATALNVSRHAFSELGRLTALNDPVQ